MAQKTIDQIATDQPLTSVTGAENVMVQQAGVSKAGALNILSSWILGQVDSTKISDATTVGKALITAASASAALTTIGGQAALTPGGSADIVTGTSTTAASWAPKSIHDAIVTIAPTPTGIVKSVNGNNPDGSGNVTLTIPAALPALSQVDATAGTSTTASSINALVLATTIANALPVDVTTTVHGLMLASDKVKLDGVAANANNYTLPAAASGVIGGVKLLPLQAQLTAAPTQTDFNNLLTALINAGVMSAT